MRTDEKNLLIVGRWMLDNFDWVLSTGRTKHHEDYFSDIIVSTSGRNRNIEVKTIRHSKRPFKSPKIKISDDIFGDGNFWLLNKTDKTGSTEKSKWFKFLRHQYDGLIFYDEDNRTIYWYNHPALMDAYRGDCELWVAHTTDLKDKTYQWETKVVIDLNKAHKFKMD